MKPNDKTKTNISLFAGIILLLQNNLFSSFADDSEHLRLLKSLSREEANDVIFFESEKTFGSIQKGSHDDGQWKEFLDYEIKVAKMDEENGERNLGTLGQREDSINNVMYPFLICCKKLTHGAVGDRCIDRIKRYFGSKIISIINREDLLCVLVNSPASIALSCPESLSVTPFLPEMKIVKGTIDDLLSLNSTKAHINIMMCPEFSERNHKNVGNLIIERIHSHGKRRMQRRNEDLLSRPIFKNKQSFKRGIDDINPWSDTTKKQEFKIGKCDDWISSLSPIPMDRDDYVAIVIGVNGKSIASNSMCVLMVVNMLSSLNEVCSVSLEPQKALFNANIQWILQSGQYDQRPLFDIGVDGSGQIVGLSDSGLDVDNCYFQDLSKSNFTKDGTVHPSRRKVVQYVPYADDNDLAFGHGTHVAGTIAGEHHHNDHKRKSVANGVAKGAKIAFFDIFSAEEGVKMPRDPTTIFRKANDASAYLHSMSWGSPGFSYGFDEATVDKYLFKNPNNLICAAAGNFGKKGAFSIATPSSAKNILTVGSSSGTLNSKKEGIADFSSRGPTLDGRMKPEMISPGDAILSACAQPSAPGSCDDNGGIKYEGGTSLSAPAVCGAAALVRQYFEDGIYRENSGDTSFMNPPSGPLIKCVLINGATPLLSESKTDPLEPYDNNQGFGRILLLNSLPLIKDQNIRTQVFDRRVIKALKVDQYVFTVDRSSCKREEVSATISWYDPPAGPGCTKCLMNDLNLYISSESKTYFSNGRNEKDNENNSERVILTELEHGQKLVINVEARDLITDDQMYALVVSGCLGANVCKDGDEQGIENVTDKVIRW